MKLEHVVGTLYRINLGMVNAYLVNEEELTLIDSGVPNSADAIGEAVLQLGRRPDEIKRIVVTHLHVDHSGSVAEVKRRSGATVYMHPLDAAEVLRGQGAREMNPTPGVLSFLVTKLFMSHAPSAVEAYETDATLEEGDTLDFAGDMRVLHLPGHAEGQIALYSPSHGGVLIAADAAANMAGRLGFPIVVEDLAVAKESLRRLAEFDFEVAVFGHGRPILRGASEAFKARFR